jgi:hypothetical protein
LFFFFVGVRVTKWNTKDPTLRHGGALRERSDEWLKTLDRQAEDWLRALLAMLLE